MTQEEMNILVPQKLHEIEHNFNVTVLYAAESGSGAWGFSSPDSDFEVRFIYKRSGSDYLRLDKVRDVIDFPVDEVWDVVGWDLDKKLKLLHASNPGLYDWIGSPICYYDTGFKTRIAPLLDAYFSELRMLHHYHNIVKHKLEGMNKDARVTAKKYFYALRAILSCRWIIEYNVAPPVPFSELVSKTLPAELYPQVEYIRGIKAAAPERAEMEHVREIDDFMIYEYNSVAEYLSALPEDKEKPWDALNEFFIAETKRND